MITETALQLDKTKNQLEAKQIVDKRPLNLAILPTLLRHHRKCLIAISHPYFAVPLCQTISSFFCLISVYNLWYKVKLTKKSKLTFSFVNDRKKDKLFLNHIICRFIIWKMLIVAYILFRILIQYYTYNIHVEILCSQNFLC